MGIEIDLAFLRLQLEMIKSNRLSELEARRIASGDIEPLMEVLFAGSSTAWRDRNRSVPNELQIASDKIREAVSTGELTWTYENQNTNADDAIESLLSGGLELCADIATEILIGGRFCLFPYMSQQRQRLELAVLSGWTYIVTDLGNSSVVLGVIQVIAQQVQGIWGYTVREFSDGEMLEYPSVPDWVNYNKNVPVSTPLPYAKGQLPIVAKIVRRDMTRMPSGLVRDALPAFARYLKDAVELNGAAEMYGRPETVIMSDFYLQLAETKPDHPLLKELKKKGPFQMRVFQQGDSYTITPPVDTSPLERKEAISKAGLAGALRTPSIDGANLSGNALEELRTAFTQTVTTISRGISEALTAVLELAALIPNSGIPKGVDISHKPKFSQDIKSERADVILAYEKGILKRSQALTELQRLGMDSITDADINEAALLEAGDAIPTAPPSQGVQNGP